MAGIRIILKLFTHVRKTTILPRLYFQSSFHLEITRIHKQDIYIIPLTILSNLS